MDNEVTIRLATLDEIVALPTMQVAAGQLFRQLEMAPVADGPTPEIDDFAKAQRSGHLLVAVRDENVIGFVRLEVLDSALHIEQVTVAPGEGGRGVGRRLMLSAEDVAREHGYDCMTLTAFRDVPFNGPFYESLGWRALPDLSLSPGLAARRREEAAAGLDAWPRQAMTKQL